MDEQKKLVFAKAYIDAMRNGVNPLNLNPIPKTDLLHDEHIQECLAYVSKILGTVIENGGAVEKDAPKRSHSRKPDYFITDEQKQLLHASDTPMIVSKIAKYISEITIENGCKQFSSVWINNWLTSIGMLEVKELEGTQRKCATQQGNQLGITSKIDTSPEGTLYYRNTFNANAQQFIYDNIDVIIEFSRNL